MTTPEMLTAMEKRRQFAGKKFSSSLRSFDSGSTEAEPHCEQECNGEDSVDGSPPSGKTKSGLRIPKPNFGGAFLFKKSTSEKDPVTSRDGSPQASPRQPVDIVPHVYQNGHGTSNGRRPSWEKPWRQSWDVNKEKASMVGSQPSLHVSPPPAVPGSLNRNRKYNALHQSCDLRDLQRKTNGLTFSPSSSLDSAESRPTSSDSNRSQSVKVRSVSKSPPSQNTGLLRQNRGQNARRPNSTVASRTEINPAALAEIAVSIKLHFILFICPVLYLCHKYKCQLY